MYEMSDAVKYAEVVTEEGQSALRFERDYPHPPEKVWRALVEPSGLEGWFPCRIEGERKVGAMLQFIFVNDNAPPTEGIVLDFEPPRLFAYTWAGEVLRWRLQPITEGSRLIFTNSLEYDPIALAAGWHTGLDELGYFLDDEPLPWTLEDRLAELQAIYAKRFGSQKA
jgi:uncharacterized protein YndB with AHSA1/START domain